MSVTEIWSVAVAVLISLGGGGVIVFALSGWLGKVWADRLMANETARHARDLELLRANVGKSVRVHAAQFEAEFAAYRDIWAQLVDVRRAVLQLRPVLDYVDPEKPEEERKRERLGRFGECFQAFLDVVDKNRPFYSPEVWSELRELIDLVHGESIDYQHKRGDTVEYYQEAIDTAKKIMAQIDVVCDSIRERIGSLSVVD